MSSPTTSCWLALWSALASPALAKPAAHTPALPLAQVYTVRAYSYEVPQVRLREVAASRRLNSYLARRIFRSNVDSAVDSLAPLAQQLRRAAQLLLREWLLVSTGAGFCGLHLRCATKPERASVAAIRPHLLRRTRNLPARLRTFRPAYGLPLRLPQLVNDPAAQLQRRLQLAVNRRLQDKLRDARAQDEKTEKLATVAKRYNWDWKTNGVRNFGADLTPEHLLLFYAVSFPRLDADFEPDDTYRFSYPSLQLSALLRPAVGQPAPQPSKKGR